MYLVCTLLDKDRIPATFATNTHLHHMVWDLRFPTEMSRIMKATATCCIWLPCCLALPGKASQIQISVPEGQPFCTLASFPPCSESVSLNTVNGFICPSHSFCFPFLSYDVVYIFLTFSKSLHQCVISLLLSPFFLITLETFPSSLLHLSNMCPFLK